MATTTMLEERINEQIETMKNNSRGRKLIFSVYLKEDLVRRVLRFAELSCNGSRQVALYQLLEAGLEVYEGRAVENG